MGAFDFAVQPGRPGFDVDMPYPQIFDVPMKLGLEFVTIVCSYCMDAEGESLDHKIDEINRRSLVVTVIDPQGPDAGGIVYGGILETPEGLTGGVFEHQELDIDLDMMSRNLLLVAPGLDGAEAGIAGQTGKPASF